MRDDEYSRSDREFSPAGQEISSPGHEWNAPPREGGGVPIEVAGSSGEYHQGSASAGKGHKKRRRLRPAMLAAAAAVTAVIAFTPAESPQYPVQELSAEHRAYLDALWDAMEASDLDKLEKLAQEDMARDIVLNVIAPYAHRMAEEYEELGKNSSFIQDGTPDIYRGDLVFQEGGRYSVHYDGEVLSITGYQPMYLTLIYESAISESSTREVFVQCSLMDAADLRSGGHFYNGRVGFFRFTENDSGSSTNSFEWWDTSHYNNNGQPAGEWNLLYRSSTYDVADSKYEIIIQGGFQPEEVDLSDTGESHTIYYCLHNGVVSIAYSDESGSTSGTLDIVDGYTVRWSDTVSIEERDRIRLYREDGTLMPSYSIRFTWDGSREADKFLQHDLLYHQFRAPFVRSN